MRSVRPLLIGILATAVASTAGCADPQVVRIVDGHAVAGRFISPRAYALYARGADAEARGELEASLAAYEAAAGEDDASPEIWTRIGAVRCRLRETRGESNEAFDRALERDASFEPVFRERARCALARRDLPTAVASGARAVQLDPDREETSILYASVLEQAGRGDEARRTLRALCVRHPTSAPAWLALMETSRRTGDPVTAEFAASNARNLSPAQAARIEASVPSLGPLPEIDAALSRGDLAFARRRAKSAHLPSSEVALRAAALGRADVAREQAELILGADPNDANARIALAVAADLTRDSKSVSRAMDGLTETTRVEISRLGRLLFAELLERRVGPEEARLWLGAFDPSDQDDALLRSVSDRLRTVISETGRTKPGPVPQSLIAK